MIRHTLACLGVASMLSPAQAAAPAGGHTADAPPSDEPRWTSAQLFSRADVFSVPPREVTLGPGGGTGAWDMARNRGNFTLFDAVTNIEVTADGALAFMLTAKKGTVGWGDCGGTQPESERVLLWPSFAMTLQVRQSMEKPTSVNLRFWPLGGRDPKHTFTVAGTNWQALSVAGPARLPRRHGFDCTLEGPAGNRIEFKDLRIKRYESQGCFRNQITLPPGAVWRATAEVGGMTRLYINGREVPSPNDERPFGLFGSESVGLTEYFVPGQVNCVAVSGRRTGESPSHLPYIYLQGSVIMQSGERLSLDTDGAWTWTPEAPEGWTAPGFDASGWRPVVSAKARTPDDAFLDNNSRYLIFKKKWDIPVYDGLVHVENPRDNQLYFTDGADMVCHVLVPEGLAARTPALDWRISRYENGALTDVKQGRTAFEPAPGGSLRGLVEGGRLPRGIYVLGATLRAGDGSVLEERIPEPFLVTGRLEMRETDGDTYAQDMDLELEREIDLTNPADGPWLEAAGGRVAVTPTTDPDAGVKEATLVERDDLKYRETKPAYGAIISYLVEFRHPGDFYLMELEYPNDMPRHMGVACSPYHWGLSKTSASVTTGERYPITGRMQTLAWLYRPDPGTHALDLVSLAGTPAAGARLRYSHIKSGLPALRAPAAHTRWNGFLTERTRPDRFGIEPTPPLADRKEANRTESALAGDGANQPVRAVCELLAKRLDAAEAFARYMRFAGHNLHMMGSFQYSPDNYPGFVPDWSFPCARVRGAIQDVLARVLRDNAIDFYAHVEFVWTPKLVALAAAQPPRPAAGFWDTVYQVTSDGREANWAWEKYGFNINHPDVRKAILDTAREVTRKYRTCSNFKGLLWTPYFDGDFMPGYRPIQLHIGPLTPDEMVLTDYSDVTLREFAKDTGRADPCSLDDPQRFAKRRQFLWSPAQRDAWLAWRAERMLGFFRDVAAIARTQRPDLKCICDLYMNPVHDEEWRRTGWPFHEYMRRNGWDGRLFDAEPTVSLAHVMYGMLNKWPELSKGQYRGWEMSSAPERFEFFKAERDRAVQVKHDWSEVEQMSWHLPPRQNWPRHHQLTLMEQPDGPNAREVFVRALIGADPDIVFYGFSDATLLEGNEQALREFTRVLRALPGDRFAPVNDTGLASNLAIRELRKDGDYWFYAANPGYWPVSGEIALEGAAAVLDAVSGRLAAKPGSDGKAVVRVELAPFGVAAFKTAAPAARVGSWKAAARPGPETAWLEGVIEGTARLLETPAARVTVLPEDEDFLRRTVAAARDHFKKGELAAALLEVSRDRFWVLKTEYLEKGARYVTDTERSEQTTTERRSARAVYVKQAPKVDADPGDAVWQTAPVYEGFISSDEMPAMARTSFQAAHDGASLYLLLRCADNKPDQIKRDAKDEMGVFKDDCAALFVRPDPRQPVYYQMAFSASGAKFDQKVRSSSKETAEFAPPWEVKTAVTKDGWLAEVKLPASSLDARLEPGAPWGFNVHRACRGAIVPPCSWSYSPGGWHEIERLGILEFELAGR